VKYWLFKSEPGEFSIDDLAAQPEQMDHWDGVRNYQARNMMRDEMRCGDQVFFYHSNTAEPGIVGIAEIVREAYPDHTAFDSNDKHYDVKSDPASPRWFMVDVRFVRKLKRVITLAELKNHDELSEFPLIRRGNRLSIMPVTSAQWNSILALE
jgi:predicted RNA-binding protein with PUA-like domain